MVSEALWLVQTPFYTSVNIHIKLLSSFPDGTITEGMTQDGMRVNREGRRRRWKRACRAFPSPPAHISLPPHLKVAPSSFLLGPFPVVCAHLHMQLFADPCFTCECCCQALLNSPAFTRHFVLTRARGHVEGRKQGNC